MSVRGGRAQRDCSFLCRWGGILHDRYSLKRKGAAKKTQSRDVVGCLTRRGEGMRPGGRVERKME